MDMALAPPAMTSNLRLHQRQKEKRGCEALGNNIFEHGQKGSADQMQNTFKSIIKYVGNTFGTNMSTELKNRTRFVIPAPVGSATTLASTRRTRHIDSRCMTKCNRLAEPTWL
jgi:hypothetical protein